MLRSLVFKAWIAKAHPPQPSVMPLCCAPHVCVYPYTAVHKFMSAQGKQPLPFALSMEQPLLQDLVLLFGLQDLVLLFGLQDQCA